MPSSDWADRASAISACSAIFQYIVTGGRGGGRRGTVESEASWVKNEAVRGEEVEVERGGGRLKGGRG